MTTSPVHVPPIVRRHRSFDAFAGAHRVVFTQVRTYFAGPDFRMPRLTGVNPEVRDGRIEHSRRDADYYDTASLALAADGLAVRWDTRAQDWTVVLPVVSMTGQPIRCEVSYPGVADVVPEAVYRLLHLHLHRRSLEKVARVASRRSTTPLICLSDIRLAEVIDERVVATRTDGRDRTSRYVSVEVLDLDGLGCTLLADLSAVLGRYGCREQAPAAELARVLGAPSWSQ